MANQRQCLAFVLLIFIIFLLIRRKPTKVPPISVTYTSLTCLNSFNREKIYQSGFHPSLIHWQRPTTLGHWVVNKTGFDVGYPAHSIWGYFGVFDSAKSVDVSHYLQNPLADPGLVEDRPFMWRNHPKGRQYNRDPVDLQGVMSNHYDFVCVADVVEHIANPLKGFSEWVRILRPGGLLMVIVSYKNTTFDRKRDVTKIEHLIADYRNQMDEDDLSHLKEILELHDFSMDELSGGREKFQAQAKNNAQTRVLHHHVYDQELLFQIYRCLNLDVRFQMTWDSLHLIIGEKH